jgi:type I restriction enzyme M protein
MSPEVVHVTLSEVAQRAEVRLSAVSNWKTRHSDFPKSGMVSGQEVVALSEIAQWLQGRRIPQNRLKVDEPLGTSYGDRFLRNTQPSGSSIAAAPVDESPPAEPVWISQLRAAADRLRGTHDTASSLELLLGLAYVKKCRTDVWGRLAEDLTWEEVHDLLAAVSLSMGTGVPPIPVFGKMSHTADRSLIEAVRLMNKIDMGKGDDPQSTAAQISEAVLADLERGMGKSGGHFTPPDVARCLVGLLDPQLSDRVYDPFCGSGELLSAAAAHVRRQSGSLGGWRAYGQTPQEWSWLTSTMNLALHGVDADLGTPGIALLEDRFPERRFSRVLMNPPYNWHVDLPKDRRWPFGEPPSHNANFAWLQHVVTKLEVDGRAAVVMPTGAASTQGSHELPIRAGMVDAGVVECVIALPRQLFRFTEIPTMVWILCSSDAASPPSETLFVDARHLGEMADRSKRRLAEEDIEQIVEEYRKWRSHRSDGRFEGKSGFSRSIDHRVISENDYVLTPGRYTGLAAERPDTARIIAEVAVLRGQLDDLDKRAAESHVTLDARLAAFIAGRHPGGGGQFVRLDSISDVLPGPGKMPRDGGQPSWTPLVLSRNIKNNRIEYEGLDVVPPATAERMKRYRLAAGDIVSARAGTLGRYGRVLVEQTGWLLGPGCVRFRPNDRVNSEYLTYYLGSPAALHWIAEHATGSAIQHVNAATLRAMPIWLPPLTAQHAILEFVEPLHAVASVHGRISAVTQKLHDLLVPVLMSPSAPPEIE